MKPSKKPTVGGRKENKIHGWYKLLEKRGGHIVTSRWKKKQQPSTSFFHKSSFGNTIHLHSPSDNKWNCRPRGERKPCDHLKFFCKLWAKIFFKNGERSSEKSTRDSLFYSTWSSGAKKEVKCERQQACKRASIQARKPGLATGF